VYLRGEPIKDSSVHPLHRLYRRWLENTYEGARALGLDTAAILKILEAVCAVEERRIPVIEADWSQAESLAQELRARLGIRTVPYVVGEIDGADPQIAAAPFLVTTPFQRGRLGSGLGDRPVIELILSRSFLQELRERIDAGSLVIVAPSMSVADQLKVAFERGQLANGTGAVQVIVATEQGKLLPLVRDAECVFLWPGAPTWVLQELDALDCVVPAACISDESLARVRLAILDTALRELSGRLPLNTSSGAAPRAGTGSAE
jgi:hypothetical protein